MTDMEQRVAAKQFTKDWAGRGDERQETQQFWMALLQKVYDIAEPDKSIEFEVPVKLGHTSFIDGFIKDTHVLIEQKGMDIDLRKGYRQSDGSMMTPFQQARRYAGFLPHNMNPRWIVVCNFKEFHIHDMNRPNDTPEVIQLAELETEYPRLQFLVSCAEALYKHFSRVTRNGNPGFQFNTRFDDSAIMQNRTLRRHVQFLRIGHIFFKNGAIHRITGKISVFSY